MPRGLVGFQTQPVLERTKAITDNSEAITALNDKFGRTFACGQVVLPRGIASLPEPLRLEILEAVNDVEQFESGDDRYGEHDFGAIERQNRRVFWKTDYYTRDLTADSDNPADPAVTCQVLTVMLAEEY